MNYKIITVIFLTVFLSSCCWFAQDDCFEEQPLRFPIGTAFSTTDSIHDINTLLEVSIKSTDFLNTYQEEGYQQFNFSMLVEWFDGNFVSTANHQVNILNSNLDNLDLEYAAAYYGDIPNDDIRFDIEFTVPGYYLIYFSGAATKTYEVKRRPRNGCGCGGSTYAGFSFENDDSNEDYFDLYNSSVPYNANLQDLLLQGAYFIKVE